MCSGPPLFCGEEVGGGGRWGRLEGESGPLFGPGVEGTGSRSNFPGFGRTFQRLCAPAWGPGPVGLAGEGGGAVLGPAGGAVTAESGPRFVPVREGATVVWTVAAGRALSGPCWRAVCRSGTDSEGRQNRLWARVFPCNGERGCTAGRGGTLAGAHALLQWREGLYGRTRGRLRAHMFPCNGERGCTAGRGGPLAGVRFPAMGRGGVWPDEGVRSRARVFSCNGEWGVWPDEGVFVGARVFLQQGERVYGWTRGAACRCACSLVTGRIVRPDEGEATCGGGFPAAVSSLDAPAVFPHRGGG
ncbi:hypothetical protein SAMN05444424_1838 [Bittarella massiliensis (ex Durand et al. 2017)]|uniref:Uncharacterized protein n=1 Tax=Bittarella massiliensis (ex Durand et al. 2017) TaxID=1720313 RepID=A0AAQ1RW71_9FIRM|nr:hypothetical protein SAMN05444424_1838 [Bittarella massiliensis (ex Durand et al. 2017)]